MGINSLIQEIHQELGLPSSATKVDVLTQAVALLRTRQQLARQLADLQAENSLLRADNVRRRAPADAQAPSERATTDSFQRQVTSSSENDDVDCCHQMGLLTANEVQHRQLRSAAARAQTAARARQYHAFIKAHPPVLPRHPNRHHWDGSSEDVEDNPEQLALALALPPYPDAQFEVKSCRKHNSTGAIEVGDDDDTLWPDIKPWDLYDLSLDLQLHSSLGRDLSRGLRLLEANNALLSITGATFNQLQTLWTDPTSAIWDEYPHLAQLFVQLVERRGSVLRFLDRFRRLNDNSEIWVYCVAYILPERATLSTSLEAQTSTSTCATDAAASTTAFSSSTAFSFFSSSSLTSPTAPLIASTTIVVERPLDNQSFSSIE
ncbi:uncharacterized protein MONBRDRAFT_38719 [Monosiga brevicollis MX1]|uniref:Uncharacterized protein n=1 Tax=Monosiga brevicollis TaxID=81824 RepID=A9V9Q2_MONBE|nr:uncharacterized protein MONBRDRAFT_38719 [Monosiga brevicollis MX1]EDQ85762.1 predicted protein [Monosiga brevicollis MX1]|eukprot:XP_001749477.1 hypothetical protein [Monosiga brevicollis MX1]